jgi:hypothetical protein
MRKLLLAFLLSALLASCGQSPNNKPLFAKINNLSADSTPGVFIKDSSDYSKSFIKSIRPSKKYYKYDLVHNILILNNKEAIKFPDIIPLNKQINFSGEQSGLKIKLTLIRISQSTIKYNFSVTTKSLIDTLKSGTADLSPYFFYGSEVDESDSLKVAYMSIQYWDPNDSMLTSVRVGANPKNERLLLAKIICHLHPFNIDLEDCPTLFEYKGGL